MPLWMQMRDKARIIREADENGIDLLELLLQGFGAGNDEIGNSLTGELCLCPELILCDRSYENCNRNDSGISEQTGSGC